MRTLKRKSPSAEIDSMSVKVGDAAESISQSSFKVLPIKRFEGACPPIAFAREIACMSRMENSEWTAGSSALKVTLP